eukprot:SAG31_NODE_17533_length_667_cov_1.091549_1_plen_36_part_10
MVSAQQHVYVCMYVLVMSAVSLIDRTAAQLPNLRRA